MKFLETILLVLCVAALPSVVCSMEPSKSSLRGAKQGSAAKEFFVRLGEMFGLISKSRSAPVVEVDADAICYAERYPDLLEAYCDGDSTRCKVDALWTHYQEHGKVTNLLWGCRSRSIEPAVPVANVQTGRRYDAMDLHLLVFETATGFSKENDMTLIKKSVAAGIRTTRIGRGMAFEGFSSKWQAILSFLNKNLTITSDTLLVITDARDVLLNIHDDYLDSEETTEEMIDHFVRAYKSLTSSAPGAVVMSAEAQCCVAALTYLEPGSLFDVDGHRLQRACSSGSANCVWGGDAKLVAWEDAQVEIAFNRTGRSLRDVFLNAGLVAGRPHDLIRLLETVDLETFEDDQAVFTEFMYRRPDKIVLDYASEMFGTARWPLGMNQEGCPFGKSSFTTSNSMAGVVVPTLYHLESNTNPLLLHTPGKFFECFDYLANELGVEINATNSNVTNILDRAEQVERFLQKQKNGNGNEERGNGNGNGNNGGNGNKYHNKTHAPKKTMKPHKYQVHVRGGRLLQQKQPDKKGNDGNNNNKKKNNGDGNDKNPGNGKKKNDGNGNKGNMKTQPPMKTKKPRNYQVHVRGLV